MNNDDDFEIFLIINYQLKLAEGPPKIRPNN